MCLVKGNYKSVLNNQKYTRENLYKTTKKVGQKALNKHKCTGEQCSQVVKIGNLRNFAGYRILQPPKISTVCSPLFNIFAPNFL